MKESDNFECPVFDFKMQGASDSGKKTNFGSEGGFSAIRNQINSLQGDAIVIRYPAQSHRLLTNAETSIYPKFCFLRFPS